MRYSRTRILYAYSTTVPSHDILDHYSRAAMSLSVGFCSRHILLKLVRLNGDHSPRIPSVTSYFAHESSDERPQKSPQNQFVHGSSCSEPHPLWIDFPDFAPETTMPLSLGHRVHGHSALSNLRNGGEFGTRCLLHPASPNLWPSHRSSSEK